MNTSKPVPLAGQFEKLQAELSQKRDNTSQTQGQPQAQKGKHEHQDGPRDMIAVWKGSQVAVKLRDGEVINGLLKVVGRFELMIEVDGEDILVMKHAVDIVKVSE